MSRYAAASHLTSASRRVVEQCRRLVDEDQDADVWAGHLVLTLLMDESLASACLKDLGISREWLQAGHIGDEVATSAAMLAIAEGDMLSVFANDQTDDHYARHAFDPCGSSSGRPPFTDSQTGLGHEHSAREAAAREATDPAGFTAIIDRAVSIGRRTMAENGVSSTHLLLALVEVNPFIRNSFEQAGVTSADIRRELGLDAEPDTTRLPVEITLSLSEPTGNDSTGSEPTGSEPATSDRRVVSEPGIACSQTTAPESSERTGLQAAPTPAQITPAQTTGAQPTGRVAGGLTTADEPRPSIERLPTESSPNEAEDVSVAARRDQLAAVWRLIDANLNRTREGLRVLEDHTRFILNDSGSSRVIKELRHAVVAAETILTESTEYPDRRFLQRHRNTRGDVGTTITVPGETARESLSEVVLSNCRRVQESLRSLEEFGKLISVEFSARIKQFRYQMYDLELTLNQQHHGVDARESHTSRRKLRLESAVLYVLITEESCRQNWQNVVEQALAGGADILQLREKQLSDKELLRRAEWLVAACREANALSIINDRCDIAVAANADGVHLGQDELSITAARKILRPGQLLGISTHNIQQFESAVAGGTDYLGVGPTFASTTKAFASFAGLQFINQVANCQIASSQIASSGVTGNRITGTFHQTCPWFAIGGINESNLPQVLSAGAQRVAVTAAVTRQQDPFAAAMRLGRQLRSAPATSRPPQAGSEQSVASQPPELTIRMEQSMSDTETSDGTDDTFGPAVNS